MEVNHIYLDKDFFAAVVQFYYTAHYPREKRVEPQNTLCNMTIQQKAVGGHQSIYG